MGEDVRNLTNRRKPTSADVARLAGVDRSTVSLVLSGKAQGRVSDAVREAVERSAHEIGYRPNAAARSLRLGRTNVIALVVPQASNPFFASVLRGAEREARRHGYAVLLVNAEQDAAWEERLIHTLSSHAVSGFVLWRAPSSVSFEALGGACVLVEVERDGMASVLLDVPGGMRAAVTHLLDLGHRRIGHFAADLAHDTFAVRAEAIVRTLAEAGLGMREAWSARAPLEFDAARSAARALLRAEPRPTAVVCDDDLLAAALLKAAREEGVVVPSDLSVVGFGNLDVARVVEPELTTVAAEPEELGRQAVESLLGVLRGVTVEAAPTVLPTRLVIRSSSAPPR
ncbi:LacI family DNA-binding transcriptional regulator [Deinococcus yavapaiensis]|uniref:LacI family transcriptional regulator n=1 Tax=Deinococcus yavapaiensis KR-236 TaxID=694435 RepID=A0A318S9E0_9DEIO|nr:LacI family DNA-binding transcriptional regulator [Deinococcus yavapaiensis]PYE52827.1 LacI family transcriptional regulator [Deinococcus yavapaiensis KR-236]